MFQILPNKILFVLTLIFGICACGVKARPIAPTVAPPISNGVPVYYKKNEVENVKSKYNSKIEEAPVMDNDNGKN